MEQHVVFLR